MATILNTAKTLIRAVGLDPRRIYQDLFSRSLRSAIREQDLESLQAKCREIVPNVIDQYTQTLPIEEYEQFWEPVVRGQHAFQVRCMLEALEYVQRSNALVVDIGDSCGNHSAYLRRVAKSGKVGRVISVNLDPVAIEKVKKNGGEAILSRAEELDLSGESVDLFMSFEMLEHLTDPARFLHSLATKGSSDLLLMTVPFVRKSRVGMTYLRSGNLPPMMNAENVHFFELSPEDWILLARFSGWTPKFTRTYLQYPRYSPLRLLAPLWRRLDYEGFFAVLLQKDLSIANRYRDW